MAISRGKRKKSKDKALRNAVPETHLKIAPQISRGKRKRRKRKANTEDITGVKLRQRRQRPRGKRVKTAKPETEKQVRRKAQKAKKVKVTKAQVRKQQRLKQAKETDVIKQPEIPAESQTVQTPNEELPLLEDIIYSTFDSMLPELGEYGDSIRQIVFNSIGSVGKEEAMKRLENYMNETKDKYNIFNLPVKYKEYCIALVSEFAKTMYGRPLSLSEIEGINLMIDRVWDENGF